LVYKVYHTWKETSSISARFTYDDFILTITCADLLQQLYQLGIFRRGLPSPQALQNDQALVHVFARVLCDGCITFSDFPDTRHKSSLNDCFRNGWLHSETINNSPGDVVGYTFPSPLHRWYLGFLSAPTSSLDRLPRETPLQSKNSHRRDSQLKEGSDLHLSHVYLNRNIRTSFTEAATHCRKGQLFLSPSLVMQLAG
jgi:hypothetical protein